MKGRVSMFQGASDIQHLMKGADTKGLVYWKSFWFILGITFVPTALIGILTYFIATSYIEKEVARTHQVQLNKAQERIHDHLSGIELNLTQWSLNPLVGEKLRSLNLVDDYAKIHDLYRWIQTMEASSPLIEKIYVYVDAPSALIDSGLTERLSDQRKNDFRSFLERDQSMFWVLPASDTQQQPNADRLILVHALSGSSVQSFGALLVYIDPQQVDKLVSDLTNDAKGTSLMLARDRKPIAGVAKGQVEYKLQEGLYGEMTHQSDTMGNFLWRWDGNTYTVSYGTMNRLGHPWTYVSATTMSNLTAPVVFISRLMIGISLTVLLLTLLVSWKASNKLYRPIQKIIQLVKTGKAAEDNRLAKDEIEWIERQWLHVNRESELYQTQLKQALPVLKESFLLQLTQGHLQSLREDEILEQMKQYGWEGDHQVYSIILIQLFGAARLRGSLSESDKQLITFAAVNITEELTSQQFDSIGVVNFRDLSVGLLVIAPDVKEPQVLKQEMTQLANDLIPALSKLLKLHVTVSLGRTVYSVKQIASSLEVARQSLSYRDIDKENQIIDTAEILPYDNEEIHYPFELEKQILQAIRTGNMQESVQVLRAFVEVLQKKSGKEGIVQLSMLQLLGGLLQVVIQTGYSPAKLYDGMNLYEQLLKLREPVEITDWFESVVIGPYMSELAQAQDSYMKKLAASVAEFIHRQYKNDISLESCAEMFGTSTVKLSYGFKQVMGINFIDYLTKVRIQKVKELLIHTDMKIHDIALEAGYQPTYFNRIFKKHEGITATEYRERHRK
jgi:AraC-like DNA-binding protein